MMVQRQLLPLVDPLVKTIVCSCIAGLFSLTCVATTLEPLLVQVNTGNDGWLGIDGSWSTFKIEVGSPPQSLSVLPNTAGQETWVIGRSGCDGTLRCRHNRGNLFLANESSTWENVGAYDLGFNPQLEDSGPGYYGYDNITLDGDVVVPDQVIAIVNDTRYWLGYMGLGIKETNFKDANKLTLLSSLVQNQSLIPSHSYGYTAGASYRLKGVPASLTLGGVDENRFYRNNASFQLSSDSLPVVSLNAIRVSADPLSTIDSKPGFSGELTLIEAGDQSLFTIDSSTAFLWLPEASCDAFSKALGLTYNDTLQVYTYGTNSSLRDTLISWNLTFTFEVADLPGSSNNINISLPFSAFDHVLSYPFPNLESNYTGPNYPYFPLRRAANNAQYTLGRVFLQEAYLTVDYERRNFSVSQARFASDSSSNVSLIAISRPEDSGLPGPDTGSSSLSTGAKAGIGVGAGVALILILMLIAFWRLGRGKTVNLIAISTDKFRRSKVSLKSWKRSAVTPVELLGDKQHPAEAQADSNNTRFELPVPAPVELPGSKVEFYELDAEKHGDGHDISAYDATTRELVTEELQRRSGDRAHTDLESRESPSGEGSGHFLQQQTGQRQFLGEGRVLPPNRTSSRFSRFVEEDMRDDDISETEPPRARHKTASPHKSQLSRKFSWES
ncbi:hypothetical protein VTN00DRAFT_3724 [Thermoascus crustaceus]|uniref:uncharacterized protein n=1 Tax=Thermoascus crustaceus TaxID=5088 RepID=UPI003744310E